MPEKHAILLRLPRELWEELRRWADADLRSVNGQIEYVLREAARRRRNGAGPQELAAGPEAPPEPHAGEES